MELKNAHENVHRLTALCVALGGFSVVQPTTAQQAIEEVIVTATRKEQSILEVPVAVTSFNQRQLEAQGIDNLQGLNIAHPSFYSTLTLADPLSNSPVRLRGIGTSGGNAGFESAVGIYVDDVYRSRGGAATTSFFDMASVEVLRGPQGTLFGKNTTAGAILQRTNPAEIGKMYGGLKAEYGNYGYIHFDGFANIPISDTMALRLSGLWEESDGFFEHPIRGVDTAWSETNALRAQLAFQPTDSLTGRVILDWSTFETPGNYGRSTRLDNTDLNGLNNTVFPSLALDTGTGGEGAWYWDPDPTGENPGPADPFSYEIAVHQGVAKMEQLGATVHLEWLIDDSMSLRSITGYRDIDATNTGGDWDFSPLDFGAALANNYEIESISQEFILSAEAQRFSWTVGLNYINETIKYNRFASVGEQFGPFYAAAVPIGLSPDQMGRVGFNFQNGFWDHEEDSLGIFGQVDIGLSETVNLLLGARWSSVEKEATHVNGVGRNREEYWDLVTSNAYLFFLSNGAGLDAPDWEISTDDEELTYDFVLQWRPSDDSMVYGKYSHGFKSGGIGLQVESGGGQPALGGTNVIVGSDGVSRSYLPDNLEGITFDPEFVDAYEVGLRYEYGGVGRLGLTAFYADYDDLQVAIFEGLSFVTVNAGTSTSKGIELENTWQAMDGLAVITNVTYLVAEYGDDVPANLAGGRERGQSPKFSYVLGLEYSTDLAGDTTVYGSTYYTYRTEMFLSESGVGPLATAEQSGFGVATATLGMRWKEFDVSVFCTNCFGEEYIDYAFNQPFVSGGSPMVNPAPPREYGVRFAYNF